MHLLQLAKMIRLYIKLSPTFRSYTLVGVGVGKGEDQGTTKYLPVFGVVSVSPGQWGKGDKERM